MWENNRDELIVNCPLGIIAQSMLNFIVLMGSRSPNDLKMCIVELRQGDLGGHI